MSEVLNESLREMCHYHQNVPQHYYLLDTLVLVIDKLKAALIHVESPCIFLVYFVNAFCALFGGLFLLLRNLL